MACTPSAESRPTPALRVAVATNFLKLAQELSSEFEKSSEYRVEVSPGSSGKIYAQIVQGAPYDVFLSADSERPRRLVEGGYAQRGTRFTYAEGRLSLWCEQSRTARCREFTEDVVLDEARLSAWLAKRQRLAIADPRTAPYGLAAQQLLQRLGIWEELKARIIVGESVGQVVHFVKTDNVEAGFVARAQLRSLPVASVLIPRKMHAPILQQAVLLKESPGGRAFLQFLRFNPQALRKIQKAGYALPSGSPSDKP